MSSTLLCASCAALSNRVSWITVGPSVLRWRLRWIRMRSWHWCWRWRPGRLWLRCRRRFGVGPGRRRHWRHRCRWMWRRGKLRHVDGTDNRQDHQERGASDGDIALSDLLRWLRWWRCGVHAFPAFYALKTILYSQRRMMITSLTIMNKLSEKRRHRDYNEFRCLLSSCVHRRTQEKQRFTTRLRCDRCFLMAVAHR